MDISSQSLLKEDSRVKSRPKLKKKGTTAIVLPTNEVYPRLKLEVAEGKLNELHYQVLESVA